MGSSSTDGTEYRLKTAALSMERLDGEVIAIDFTTGKYFSFQGTAADLIWLLQSEIPRVQWLEVVREEFNHVMDADLFESEIDQFLTELSSLELVEPVELLTGLPTSLPADYSRGSWETPKIMVEDELVDLLVIDPIHDTGEDGWPEIKQG